MTTQTLECWRCGGEGDEFDLPSHPDGGGTVCHTCWEEMFGDADAGPEPVEPAGGWKCCVCGENWVDAANGYDTCGECLGRA